METPWWGVADGCRGQVAIVTRKQQTVLTFVDLAAGAVIRNLRFTGASQIVNLVLDDQTDHLFVIRIGATPKQNRCRRAA